MCVDQLDDESFRALGHRDRRTLLRVIGDGEQAVGALVDATGIDQPVVSRQLKVLRDAGLVAVRVDGNRRLYSVDFACLGELRTFLDGFWNERLVALKATAESEQPAIDEEDQ